MLYLFCNTWGGVMGGFSRFLRYVFAIVFGVIAFGLFISLVGGGMDATAANIIITIILTIICVYNIICLKVDSNLLIDAIADGNLEFSGFFGAIGQFFVIVGKGIRMVFVFIGKGIGMVFMALFVAVSWPIKKLAHATSNGAKSLKDKRKNRHNAEVEKFIQEYARKYGRRLTFKQAELLLNEQKEKERREKEEKKEQEQLEKEHKKEQERIAKEQKKAEEEKRRKETEDKIQQLLLDEIDKSDIKNAKREFIKAHDKEIDTIQDMVNGMIHCYHRINNKIDEKKVLDELKQIYNTSLSMITGSFEIIYGHKCGITNEIVENMFDSNTGEFIENPSFPILKSIPGKESTESLRVDVVNMTKRRTECFKYLKDYNNAKNESEKEKALRAFLYSRLRINVNYDYKNAIKKHGKDLADIGFIISCLENKKDPKTLANELGLNDVNFNVDYSQYKKFLIDYYNV